MTYKNSIHHHDTNNIVCPYCGHETFEEEPHSSGWTENCGECDKDFIVDYEIIPLYTTSKIV